MSDDRLLFTQPDLFESTEVDVFEPVPDPPPVAPRVITGASLVHEARAFVVEHRSDTGGTACPVCDQHVQLYRRAFHSTMARTLIAMYRAAGRDFVHVPSLVGHPGDTAKGRWWGVTEELDAVRPDGGRAGWWRVTDKGERFVLGRAVIPSHVLVYLNRVEGFDGDMVSIREVLGERFRYDELMGYVEVSS
jgi:hypothetical protein